MTRCVDEERGGPADDHLVERALGGDAQAFDCLVQRHEAVYQRVAERLMGDPAEAQDVVQDALINMFRKLYTFRTTGSFRSWSCQIVRNTGLMALRSKRRRREVALDELAPGGLSLPEQGLHLLGARRADPDRALFDRELARAISQAVEALEPKYRDAFVLRELHGLPMNEVGRRLELSEAGAKTRLHRARLTLRASLAEVWAEVG